MVKRDPHPGRNIIGKSDGTFPVPGGGVRPMEYNFKKKKRKDLVNGMQITVFSMTDAELDKKLQKEIELAVEKAVKEHKDSKALAYTIVKE